MTIHRKSCEFFLVRYVPDPVKNEFVNIGILLREATGDAGGETLVRFTRDWRRVRCLDPDADVAALEALETEIRRQLGETGQSTRPILSVLQDSFSNQVQLTTPKGCLAENLLSETEQLMKLYIEPRKRESVARKSTRQAIHDQMRTVFERAAVWDFMRKRIPVTQYVESADTLRIDCGYQNGKVRMFHAVSLEDVDPAKVLAFTMPELAAGVRRESNRELEFTAIVEPLRRSGPDGQLNKSADQLAIYDSGKHIMERAGIRFMTTSDLPEIADRARRELPI